MSLFNLGKKKEETKISCGCGGACDTQTSVKKECCCSGGCNSSESSSKKSIKVLGSGCTKCNELEANLKAALNELGMDIAIEHVRDFAQIAAYGVMSTPALVIDNKVVSYGKVLKKDEAIEILKKY